MSKREQWIKRHAPLGLELTGEIGLYLLCMIAASSHQILFFLLNYSNAYQELFVYSGGKKALIKGAVIQPFENLTEGIFAFGSIVCIVSLLTVIYHYLYHYQGSKMMYLMKRLPDRRDLHRRCWTLPVTGAVLMALGMLILRIIFYVVYIVCTPSQCLPF